MRKNKVKGKRGGITRIVVLASLLAAVVILSSFVTKSGSSETISNADSQALTRITGAEQQRGYADTLGPIAKMVAALIIVILCIYIGLFLLRKMMGRRHSSIGGSGALQVLQTAYLAPRRSVSLVKVAKRAVLVGVTDNQLSVLAELSEEETAELEQEEESSPEPEPFGRFLGNAMEKMRDFRLKRQTTVTSTQ